MTFPLVGFGSSDSALAEIIAAVVGRVYLRRMCVYTQLTIRLYLGVVDFHVRNLGPIPTLRDYEIPTEINREDNPRTAHVDRI
jgi:hypothetical protein